MEASTTAVSVLIVAVARGAFAGVFPGDDAAAATSGHFVLEPQKSPQSLHAPKQLRVCMSVPVDGTFSDGSRSNSNYDNQRSYIQFIG